MMNIDSAVLCEKARWVWKETMQIHRRAPETRVASSLSVIEIFVALYYGGVLQFDAQDPKNERRDRCIISKGHGSICMYPILADLGFFSTDELQRVCHAGSFLGGIPDPIIPGYETINGSLGHGLGVGAGVAMGLRVKKSESKVFVVVGDGELHEGSNWEAIMFASHHGLDNLNLIVDDNKISMLDYTKKIISHDSLSDRLQAFGWDCIEVIDGHDVVALQEACLKMKCTSEGKPKALIAHTKKGHGVPGLEGVALSHIMSIKPELVNALLLESD